MKWKTLLTHKHGDTKEVTYFAWIPTRLDDGYTVWLEWYHSNEVFYSDNKSKSASNWRSIKTFSKETYKKDIQNALEYKQT